MNSVDAVHNERARRISEKYDEVLEYFTSHGGNWLGQLLKTMSQMAKVNFDSTNTLQYRRVVLEKYYKFIADKHFEDVAKRDAAFSACLSFANMFGVMIEEINDKSTITSNPATVDLASTTTSTRKRLSWSASLTDSDGRPSSVKTRRSLAIGGQSRSSLDNAVLTPSPPAPLTNPFVGGDENSLVVNTIVADGEEDTLVKTRGAKKVVPTTGMETVVKRERHRVHSGEPDFDYSPPSITVVCAECGEKVKESGMRRHMKGHTGETRTSGTRMIKTEPLDSYESTEGDEPRMDSLESLVEQPINSSLDEGTEHMEEHNYSLADKTIVRVSRPAHSIYSTPDNGGELMKDKKEYLMKQSSSWMDPTVAGGDEVMQKREEAVVEKPAVTTVRLDVHGQEEESRSSHDDGEEDTSTRKEKVLLAEWAANMFDKEGSCHQCNKSYANYKVLSNHLYQVHHGLAGHNFVFMCLGCHKQFRSYHGTIGHVKVAIRKNLLDCKNKVVYLGDGMGIGQRMITLKKEPLDEDAM